MKTISTILLCLFCNGFLSAQPAGESPYADGSNSENYPLNLPDKADAYSCLSKDGLRIYFSRDNSAGEIWKAERKSLNDKFINPTSVSIDGLKDDSDIFSCWLSEDEKTLFFISQQNDGNYANTLYKATFNQSSKSFINPIKINLIDTASNGESNIFISGPSLTEDFNQLYVYYSDQSSTDRIACYTTVDGLNYKFSSFVTDAINYCPGSIGDRGLSYYLTLRNMSNVLVKLSRKDLNSEFSNPEYFTIGAEHGKNSHDSLLADELYDSKSETSYYQPSVNTALGIFSITVGEGTWESNNLEILKLPMQTMEDVLTNTPDFVQPYEILETFVDTTVLTTGYFTSKEIEDTSGNNEKYWLIEEYSKETQQKHDSVLEVDVEPKIAPESSDLKAISIEVFPNPAENYIQIKYDLPLGNSEKSYFELMDLSGKILKCIELTHISGIENIEISDLSEGIYVYRLRTIGSLNISKRLIVRR